MTGPFRRTWRWLRRPSCGIAAGSLLLIGAVAAGAAWGGFQSFLAYSNTLEFCTSCHEMRAFVFEESRERVHFQNASGVRAICADCHVPRAFVPKMLRKMKATFVEVPSHFMGTLDTAEKFEANRMRLAENVWAEMKANDSLQCRGCHDEGTMTLAMQAPRARGQHESALESGETCIDCHKGIAHELPEGYQEATEEPTEEEQDFSL